MYKSCVQCCMDTSDPDITFNDQGICNHCLKYAKDEEKRKAEAWNLPLVYAALRESGRGKKYDVLLGLSGGVDSSLCLHYLIENGIRPLCFSIDNGWQTKEAQENIMRLVEGLKVPFYRYTIDLNVFKELQAAFIKSGTKNIEIPTDHILMASTFELAHKYKIKWIISGGNLATESVMPVSWGYQPKDLKFLRSISKRFSTGNVSHLPLISLLTYIIRRFVNGIRTINLLDYYEYNRQKAKQILQSNYGWKDYGEKHCESTFTWWFQNFYLFNKWGIDKRRAHLSSLILSGQTTREEAIEVLKEKPVYPILGIENQVKYPKHDYKEYPNDEWKWNLLSKLYAYTKKRI